MGEKDWIEYSQYILNALEDNKADHKDIATKLDSIEDKLNKDIRIINSRLNIMKGIGIGITTLFGTLIALLRAGLLG